MKALSFYRDVPRPQEMYPAQSTGSFSLLHAKLAIPSLHHTLLTRPRLTAELNKGSNFKLTLISAPTGFGKTTMLSEWAHQSDLPVAWLSLSNCDNDPAHFLVYLAIALTTLSEEVASRVLELLPQDHLEAILADEITNFMTTISQECVLVLDDYHCLHNPVIHAAILSLIEHLPEHIHMVIASRTRPLFPLPRLRAYRQLHEIRPTNLLFTQEEVTLFLSRILGHELSVRQAEDITRRTEGWIAILNLLALWLQKQHNGFQALERANDSFPYITEYLQEEVLRYLSQDAQSFLLQSSILTRLNCSLCDALTGNSDSHLLLEEAVQANLFLPVSDDQVGYYSFYQPVRTFMRERLERLAPEKVPILHHRASVWYEREGMIVEAVSHTLALQDFKKSAELLLDHGEHLLMLGEAHALVTWLEAFPEELIRESPSLCQLYEKSVTRKKASFSKQIEKKQTDTMYEFSKREMEILQAITTGLSNQEIAQKMVIAESTVKWHVKNIYSKLQVRSRTQAVIKAQKLCLV